MNADAEPGYALMNIAIPLTRGAFAVASVQHAHLRAAPWHCTNTGYAARRVDGRVVLMHRVVAKAIGISTRAHVDHINGDKLDNRDENLRAASYAENNRNKTAKTGGTSRFKGVSLCTTTGRWKCRLMLNYREIWLGRFDTELEAQDAYAAAAVNYFGEFAAPRVERKS